jgi:hypothetical protein
MKSFIAWAILSAAVLGLFRGVDRRAVRAAERATGGRCAVVANTGYPEDVISHLAPGETALPVRRFGGDHQIACVPRSADAEVRLKTLTDLAFASRMARECAAGECGR